MRGKYLLVLIKRFTAPIWENITDKKITNKKKSLLARKLINYLTCFLLFSTTAACQSEFTITPTSNQTFPTMTQETPNGFRIVGYVTKAVLLDSIPYDKLTHINYAFLIPNPDGTLDPSINTWKLDQIVKASKIHQVKVLISVGGWGYDAEFEALAANPESRKAFIENLLSFVEQHDLDGIDIDWEYPNRESSEYFLALMRDIRTSLSGEKQLTAAVASHGKNGEGIPAASFKYMDFINVMAYDGIEHASLNHTQVALDYWLARGVQRGKLVLGVPFYSRPIAVPYRRIIQSEPSAAYVDETTYDGAEISYNGIPTIQLKTEIALHRASGIMIWNLEYDSMDQNTSLLNAIYKKVKQAE
jgi:GH18 family chitinase